MYRVTIETLNDRHKDTTFVYLHEIGFKNDKARAAISVAVKRFHGENARFMFDPDKHQSFNKTFYKGSIMRVTDDGELAIGSDRKAYAEVKKIDDLVHAIAMAQQLFKPSRNLHQEILHRSTT